MNIRENIVAAYFYLICLLAFAFLSACTPHRPFADDFENGLFMFDSSRHEVRLIWTTAHWNGPDTFAEFDTNVRARPNNAIFVGEVAGPSINRIMVGADSHVITPILVHHIIHLGDEISGVQVGEIINVGEGISYVTEDSEEYTMWGIPLGSIVSNRGSWPMEVGNRYLIYTHLVTGEIFRFNDEPILSASGWQSVYLLDPKNPERARLTERAESNLQGAVFFPQWWHDAMEKYGHLAE